MDILKKIIIFIIVNLELRLKSASDYKVMCTTQFEATNNKKKGLQRNKGVFCYNLEIHINSIKSNQIILITGK